MARKAGSSKASDSWGKSQFVSISLTKDQQEHLTALVTAEKIGWDTVLACVHEGFKFSLNRDSTNSTFVASLSWFVKDSGQPPIILTGRGATAFDAVCSLAYKHDVVTEGAWADETYYSGDAGRFS